MKPLVALFFSLLVATPGRAQTQPSAAPPGAPPAAATPSIPVASPPAPPSGSAPASPEAVAEAFRTAKKHAAALTASTGALTGVVLLEVYIGIVHADQSLEAKTDGKVVEAQLNRHLTSLGVLEFQIKQLKTDFEGQKGFQNFLTETQKAVDLLQELAAIVRSNAQKKTDRATSPYLRKKEALRTYLLQFIRFPDNRDLAP